MSDARKLYECTLEMTLYVLASDEKEARTIASDNISEERHNYGEEDLDVRPITNAKMIAPNWRDSFPYVPWDDDGPERTCAQILGEARQ